MRILFTFAGGHGHLEPLLPIARAACAAGHAVAFGCAPPMAPPVEAAGFRALAMGAGASRPRERLPLRPVDRRREERDLRERFARRAARHRMPLAIAHCRAWRPDVVVCDETDFGSALAAERLGLPCATVAVTATGSFVRAEVVGEVLEELRAEHGLPPDPGLESPRRSLVLSPFPPSLRDPARPPPPTEHPFRPFAAGSGERARAPAWASVRAGAPTLYLTLGTVFNTESGDLLARALEGLRALPANLLVTVGPGLEPAELGPQPPHVRVERYVPQAEVLPHCDLVVSHAGSGSLLGALAHGLPSVLVPIGADQPLNAERGAALGVAEVLDALALTPQSVRDAAARVLGDRAFARNAASLRDEIAALPGPAHAVGLLERLAGERRPLRAR